MTVKLACYVMNSVSQLKACTASKTYQSTVVTIRALTILLVDENHTFDSSSTFPIRYKTSPESLCDTALL